MTKDDQKVIGDTNPFCSGGFSVNARVYGFDLTANFTYSIGNDIYNANKIEYTSSSKYKYRNMIDVMAEEKRWTNLNADGTICNDPTQLAAMNANTSMWSPWTQKYVLTDWAVEDGSFLRLATLSIGYTLPQTLTRKVGIQNLRFYATGYNLFCITNYSGFDPEVSTRTKSALTPGVDYSAYPKSRQYVIGLNLTLLKKTNIEKLLYTVIAAMPFCGSSLLMTSCDDLFDTKSPSSMDDSNIFSIYDLAEGTIKNIYIYYGEQNYRARYLPWYGYNTDIEWYSSSEQVGDGKADLAVYKVSSNNSQMNLADGKEPWSNIYQGIEKANLAIQGLRTYADLTDKNMAHLYGEALTMRAMAYVDLINAWGDVPARFEPTTTETMYAARTDKDVIYKQLIKDLQEAENMVAWPNEMDATTTVERINKAFVKGLLARVCLQASGYSLRSDGNSSLSSDPELAKSVLYPIALQACKDVMAEEGKYVALKTNFEDIFIDNCRDIIKAGSESLWEIPYNNEPTARGRQVYTSV